MQDTLPDISSRLVAIAQQIHRPDITERLHESDTAQQARGISVAVIGPLGRGKSTLINALLGREVLPTSTASTEQSYTIITIAKAAKAIVRFSNGEQKSVTPIPAALTDAAKRGSLSSIEIDYPSNQLEEGMRIWEAPGLDPDHQEALAFILGQANAVIYVMDARQPLSQEERSMLASLPAHITKLLIAATRFDEIAETERDEVFSRAIQQIEDLHVPIDTAVHRVAAQLILKDQHEPALAAAWRDFKQAVLKIPPAPFTMPQPRASQIKALSALTKELHAILAQDGARQAAAPSPLGEQQLRELEKTRDLLKQVIVDQTNDIRQTLKDSFTAFLFQLQEEMKGQRFSVGFVESRVNAWLNKEKTRLEVRFNRLYKSVLEDAGSALRRPLEFKPEIAVQSVHYTAPHVQAAPAHFPANLTKEQRSLLIAGGTVVVIGGLLNGPVGWTLLVGAGVAGITLYFFSERRHAGGVVEQTLSKVEINMPEEIEKTIQDNSSRLQKFIEDAFRKGPVLVNGPGRNAGAPDSALLADLRSIQETLDRLGNE